MESCFSVPQVVGMMVQDGASVFVVLSSAPSGTVCLSGVVFASVSCVVYIVDISTFTAKDTDLLAY